ncbi:MAG TPA: TIM barrel protein [Planctomycetota bacterium]|nr:TIM barrel protein [Planctomycetota bacterium]
MSNPEDRRSFLFSSAFLAASLHSVGGSMQEESAPSDDRPGRRPKTRFAVNVEMWFRKLPFLKRLEAAADLGFPAVEFWPYRGKDLKEIAKICDARGIEVAQFTAWGFSPGMNDRKNHDQLEQEIRLACAAAKDLKCKKMTVVGGNDQPGMTQNEMHDNIIAGLKRVAPIAEEHDVMLILEPMNIRVDHKGHCLYGSPAPVRICREVGSTHVKINWDLYHMQISEGDLCGRLREGFDQVGYLQLADHPGRNEPGTGEISYNRVLKEAYDLGYRGYVGLECSPLEGDDLRAAKRVALADTW